MNQRGFTVIEVVVVLAAVVILAGVGFVAYTSFTTPKPADTASHSPEKSAGSRDHDMNDMSQVTSTKDLDDAATALDDASFEDDGQATIDTQSNQF